MWLPVRNAFLKRCGNMMRSFNLRNDRPVTVALYWVLNRVCYNLFLVLTRNENFR